MKLSKGFVFTFLWSLCWAISIIMSRIVLTNGENPYNLAFWTTLGAAPYWIWLFHKELQNVKKLKLHDIQLLIIMSLISSIGVSFTEIFALKYSPAINFSLLIRTVSVFTIILAAIFLHEQITKKKIVLLSTLLIGSFFLITKGQGIHLSQGDMFTLTEALLIAIGTNVLAKVATNRMPADTASSSRVLIALIPILLISMANTSIRLPQEPLLILTITLFELTLTYLMFHAFKHATASFVTMVMSFTPVLVALMAVPLLGESLTPIQLFGGGCIILAGIFVEKLKI